MRINDEAAKSQRDLHNLQTLIFEKFGLQWSTLKKAFGTLNLEKTGQIRPYELRHILEHWGIVLTQKDFDQVFKWFDKTSKGYFTIKELQTTVGDAIQPQEGLYFRQDNSVREHMRLCGYGGCQRRPLGYSDLCIVHLKEQKQIALHILLKIYHAIHQKELQAATHRTTSTERKTASRWSRFVHQLVQRSKQYRPTGSNTIILKVFLDAAL